jgi:hypothetical protein
MGEQTRLKVLLEQRHLAQHKAFCQEYDRAARAIDPKLAGKVPCRAQLLRWLNGEVARPNGHHPRVLEKMLPGWTVKQLFEPISDEDAARLMCSASVPGPRAATEMSAAGGMKLVMNSAELATELAGVLNDAHRILVAVGSRSREPEYLRGIERVLVERPNLTHYRILIGPPHSQVFKDHLLRLIELRDSGQVEDKRLRMSIQPDTRMTPERFFVASDRSAVVLGPSANCHTNFDTGFVVTRMDYVNGLQNHAQGLYSKNRLTTAEAVEQLEVLE